MIAPTRDSILAMAVLGPEPHSIEDWAEIARKNGGRLLRGRNHWETAVEYKIGHVWDEELGVWVKP